MFWNSPGTSLILRMGKNKVCVCGGGEGVEKGNAAAFIANATGKLITRQGDTVTSH